MTPRTSEKRAIFTALLKALGAGLAVGFVVYAIASAPSEEPKPRIGIGCQEVPLTNGNIVTACAQYLN